MNSLARIGLALAAFALIVLGVAASPTSNVYYDMGASPNVLFDM